jgi:hypothetical protein
MKEIKMKMKMINLLERINCSGVRIDYSCSSCWKDLVAAADPINGSSSNGWSFTAVQVDEVDVVVEIQGDQAIIYYAIESLKCYNDYDPADDGDEASTCSNLTK